MFLSRRIKQQQAEDMKSTTPLTTPKRGSLFWCIALVQFGALTHAHGALTVILVHFFPANSFVSVRVSVRVSRGVRAHAHGRKLTVSIPQHSSSLVSRLPQRGTVPAGNLATPVTVLSRTPRPLLGGRGHGYRKRQICVFTAVFTS